MTISINGKPVSVDHSANTTLESVLDSQGIPPRGVAAALNNRVIPRQQWSVTAVSDGDAVTIIKAICGG